jgi:hypothetical protein
VTTLLVGGIDIIKMTTADMRGMIERDDTMVTEIGIWREINGDMMIEIEIEIVGIPVNKIEIEIVDILTVAAIVIAGDRTCTFAYWRLNKYPRVDPFAMLCNCSIQ